MISVNPSDRDVLRFLWVKDPFSSSPELTILRFTRVTFGVSASPFLLNATIKHHLEGYVASRPEVVQLLNQSMYVDDVVCGADSEQKADVLYSTAKEILSHACFNLRKFTTNAPSLQGRIDAREAVKKSPLDTSPVVEADETYAEVTLATNKTKHPTEQKVLGIRWNVAEDQLVFSLDIMLEGFTVVEPTKRAVISLIGRIYDPLGFLSPVTVCFKMLMQELCKNKLGWDQPLSEDLRTKWTRLIDQLSGSPSLTLPRCCLKGPSSKSKTYQLHGFCDASLAAYAAVVYLVEEDEHGKYSHFIVAKTRVAPLKTCYNSSVGAAFVSLFG